MYIANIYIKYTEYMVQWQLNGMKVADGTVCARSRREPSGAAWSRLEPPGAAGSRQEHASDE